MINDDNDVGHYGIMTIVFADSLDDDDDNDDDNDNDEEDDNDDNTDDDSDDDNGKDNDDNDVGHCSHHGRQGLHLCRVQEGERQLPRKPTFIFTQAHFKGKVQKRTKSSLKE